MRRFLLFIMAFLYITLTSGVAVNVHYCMDRMVAVTYGHEKDHACKQCGMKQKSDCCRTEHKFVKSTIDHLAKAAVDYSLLPAVAELPIHHFAQVFGPLSLRNAELALYHSPPDRRLNALTVYISVFRV